MSDSPRTRARDRARAGTSSPVEEAPGPEPREGEAPVAGNLAAKRALDVVLASLGLLLSAPLWALIVVAIKLEDGGDVFYRHQRVGKDCKPFTAIKFRTMVEGDHYAVRGRPKTELITRVGRWIRPTALDELPQLVNVVRGDMSLVGPRPLPRWELSENEGEPVLLSSIHGYEFRHRVRPGLTGFAQTRVPRDVSYRRKFRYDRLYVKKRSLLLDVGLIAKSVWISVRGRWPEVGRG